MSTKESLKWTYKVVRSIFLTTLLFIVFLYVALYITLSIPGVQRMVRDVAEEQLSILTGGHVNIGQVEIYPFNEVVVKDLELYEPDGKHRCLSVERVGAGINLWNLVRHGKIIVTYAELIKPEISLRQYSSSSPLNIQFLIDAFAPKGKNKPPTKFNLRIGNIVIRKGKVAFDKEWLPHDDKNRIDFNHLQLHGLNADVALPHLSNDDIRIDLRRLAFILNPGFEVKRISALASISNGNISIKNLCIELLDTKIAINDQFIPLGKYKGLKQWLDAESANINLTAKDITPAEFAPFYPPLAKMSDTFNIALEGDANIHDINVRNFSVSDSSGEMKLILSNLSLLRSDSLFSDIALEKLNLKASSAFNTRIARQMLPALTADAVRVLNALGNLNLELSGNGSIANKSGELQLKTSGEFGSADIDALLISDRGFSKAKASIKSKDFNVGVFTGNNIAGIINLAVNADVNINNYYLNSIGKKTASLSEKAENISAAFPSAQIDFDIASVQINGYTLQDIAMIIEKADQDTNIEIVSTDKNFDLTLNADLYMAGEDTNLNIIGFVNNLRPGVLGILKPRQDFSFGGDINVDLIGDSPDNLSGNMEFTDIYFNDIANSKSIKLKNLNLNAAIDEADCRLYSLQSDWITGEIQGCFTPLHLPQIAQKILAEVAPSLISYPNNPEIADYVDDATFNFTILRNGAWAEYLNLPIRLLYEANLKGEIDAEKSRLKLSLNAPYIQQGKDKLIQHTRLDAAVESERARVNVYSSIPTKKGVLDLAVDVAAKNGIFDIDLGFNPGSSGAFYGNLALQAKVSPQINNAGRDINVKFLPGSIFLNGAEWNIGEAKIDYADGQIKINGLSIAHDDQFLTINGIASASEEDEVLVKLRDIDLDYIFETLNIEVAQFGGRATGEAVGKGLLSSNLDAFTKNLHVKGLKYNGALLGDGYLRGNFDIKNKRVGIFADINEAGRHAATVDGGIWIGKDSLAFDFDANKVRIGFLQYFMKAFSSRVEGRASGKAHLYGTFKDVNMAGRMYADSIAIKVDYTNVTYSGKDSVIIDPGRIVIPSFRLYDNHGHTGILSGTLTHDYFHSPEFDFRVSNCDNLLLYDTNSGMNSIWYGRIFGSGSGRILGNDDYVRILADMTAESGSEFTFSLDDSKIASDYGFLTFTDKARARREAEHSAELSEPDEIIRAFQKKVAEQAASSSVFAMDIRATITPGVKLILVMDPQAGDKITAHGSGAMNISYDSASDEMKMYGKYTITEGVYNFSLQDIILKDFIIKEGSSISFNGDPMSGILNIRGAYRVNANLTDLDLSFATDKDLNRVNVPVDAMLLVTGEMEHPDIKFDIELPTLNSETEQKVRSIISSEDMMNTQMIYLLALNRFYTPEYSANGNSGGEWASVASSTLSSQLQNILGQMTDKVTIAPSLRSDKGDFSDLQVDVALSSRLFNNRLLINGNLGYRDPSTSSTTFIGDFDIEYLLNRSGNLRLKAYNHFNDQNYYLKSALTTQGIGIVWRKDFVRLFRKKNKSDSVQKASSKESSRVDEISK